jgi:RNA polymerase sigma-70 factor (ECF subfamily)
MLADEEKSRVRAALGMLPMPERVVLILLHGEGLSVREVASALGITPSLVKNRAFRGRRRLRTVLSGSDGADAKDPVRSPAT